ncbi:lia operon protein LiaF [Virgibacillus halotolerans]|uniref:cell wall-active antibiotics response protein LiaF n=1 Tax=Virgibacillus halotolerans TaxID=1071053 RepID=UPI00195FD648|nr:cell wall-active antibiotics response protein LiaF [Virgibacillus halotolerans]MBM7600628.1 lia operon protein LiaF [Virgibacillus halotolerans]
MFQRLTTDRLNWILIIGVILFIIEIAFFHGGMIISALFCGCLIYVGKKMFDQLWGKIVFWIGVIGLIFAVLNMFAVRFLLVAIIVLFIIDYSKSKKEAVYIKPNLSVNEERMPDSVIAVESLFKHQIFGDQSTADAAYQWRDVNIHGGFGDRVIDLSNTVLPRDTAVISIRHIVGNIEIYVPYEVEVSIHHSSIFGRAHLLGKHDTKLMNQSISYQTKHYDDTTLPRIKIVTALFSGDIEVKRI